MRWLLVLSIASCGSPPTDAPKPSVAGSAAPQLMPAPVVDAVAVAAADASPPAAGVTPIKALPTSGPFPSLVEACKPARPCGGTEIDDATGTFKNRPATADCTGTVAPSVEDAAGKTISLVHSIAGGEVRLAPVLCAIPEGIHIEQAEYYAFVKRPDGWYRAGPLFTTDVNTKYCGMTYHVLWNDKPARTIIGIAASETCPTCGKQGTRATTEELMVRVETAPKVAVFAPMVVGQRATITSDNPGDCKPQSQHFNLAENWLTDDEVILSGPASWLQVTRVDGIIRLGLGEELQPSNAGHYEFVRSVP